MHRVTTNTDIRLTSDHIKHTHVCAYMDLNKSNLHNQMLSVAELMFVPVVAGPPYVSFEVHLISITVAVYSTYLLYGPGYPFEL